MNKTVFCPTYIGKCLPQEIVDILYKIPNTKSNTKIAVDEDLAILERYVAQPDVDALISEWIQLLINSFPHRMTKVKKIANSEKMNDQQICLELAKEVLANRRIVVDEEDDYFPFKDEVKLSGIQLVERHEAHKIFEKNSTFCPQTFSRELIAIAHRLCERRINAKLENFKNDMVTDFLRNRDYVATDQTRSGKSSLGLDLGELDIAVRRKDGVIESIIEAFRLNSCGKKNSVIAEHINKLVHDYDSTGVSRSFAMIYAETQSFGRLWKGYVSYIEKLNDQISFKGDNKLISFRDVSDEYNCAANIRAGLAIHRRDIANLEVLHVFVKME